MSDEPTKWLVDDLPELVGLVEACEIVGAGKTTMNRWMAGGSGPHGEDGTHICPFKRTARGPVWVKSDLEKWAREFGHQRNPGR